MPPPVLSAGVSYPLVAGDIRALPASGCHVFITAGTATSADFSNNSDMTGAKNSVIATGSAFSEQGAQMSAGFLRINGGTAVVRVTER